MELHTLRAILKVLAEDPCLQMIGLLAQQERSLTGLAEAMEASPIITAQYIAKLRLVGLVNLRQAGEQQVYVLDQRTMARLKAAVADLETIARPLPKPEKEWIDALPIEAWEKKVMHDHFIGSRLRELPEKEQKLLVILNWLATRFETERIYSEGEVNVILSNHHADYASLRRGLISFGFLQRSRDGRQYWVRPAAQDSITEDGGLLGERLRESGITPLLRQAIRLSAES